MDKHKHPFGRCIVCGRPFTIRQGNDVCAICAYPDVSFSDLFFLIELETVWQMFPFAETRSSFLKKIMEAEA